MRQDAQNPPYTTIPMQDMEVHHAHWSSRCTNEVLARLLASSSLEHHADPTGVYQAHRVGMMHECSPAPKLKPSSQILEALLLATGGNRDGIILDPFEAEEEADDSQGGTRAMEANGETPGMGQALPGTGGLPASQRAQQTELKAKISEVENDISELRNRKGVFEGQLINAQRANDTEKETFLQGKITQLNEELHNKDQTLKKLQQQALLIPHALVTRLTDEISKIQDTITKLETRKGEIEGQLQAPAQQHANNQNEALSEELKQIDLSITVENQRVDQLQKEQVKYTKLIADISQLEDTITELQGQLETAKQENNQDGSALPEPITQMELRLTNENQRLEQLKQEQAEIEECEVRVENARRKYKKHEATFIPTLFYNVTAGRVDYVRQMIEALEREGVNIAELINDNGHSLMHKALLDEQRDIVEFLLKHRRGVEMARKPVKTTYCEKLTPLYIALQKDEVENLKGLLDLLTPEEVNTLVDNKDYKNTFFNELPLAIALWSSVGNKDLPKVHEMFQCLVKKGADLDLQTTEDENTLLHLLVAQSCQSVENLDYFRAFLRQTFTKAAGICYNREKTLSDKDAEMQGTRKLLQMENKMGFTPLSLAAKLESPLYSDLISWKGVMRYPIAEKSQQFSNFDAYDVTKVTSLKSSKKGLSYNPNSVMHVLAHNNIEITQPVCGKDISKTEPLKSIINLKWDLYHYIFYCWGLLHLVYMCTFTSIVFYFGPNNTLAVQTNADEMVSSANSSNASSLMTQMLLESGYYGSVKEGNPWFISFVLLPLVYIIFEIIDHCSVGFSKVKCRCSFTSVISYLDCCISSLFHLTGNGIYRLISMLFSIFTLIWIILHMIQNVNQDIILSMALLFGWLFCIMFTRTITVRSCQIGIFSIMVQRMLFYDLFPFLIISAFILVGFSSAIHATLLHSEETTTEGTKFKHTLFDMLKYYSALDDPQDHKSSREKEFAKAVLAVFGIISVVLLINMLIAAMNKTYDMVRATKRDLVLRQRLAVILMLERRLPFQWLIAKSEEKDKFEDHDQKRLFGVVSMK